MNGRTARLVRRCSRSAFTLIELLVVIAIIAVLAALLFPALRRGLQQANVVRCMSNERQMAIATIAYTTDHDGFFPIIRLNAPHAIWWPSLIKPYLGTGDDVFLCSVRLGDNPTHMNTYTVNGAFWMFWFLEYGQTFGDGPTVFEEIRQPSNVVMIYESTKDLLPSKYKPDPVFGGDAQPAFQYSAAAPYHSGRHFYGFDSGSGVLYGEDNVAFVDGHVGTYSLKDVAELKLSSWWFSYPVDIRNAYISMPVPKDGPPGPLGEFWFVPWW